MKIMPDEKKIEAKKIEEKKPEEKNALEVIALVGPSGTGKSHRALLVAHQYKADAILDDGILIKDGKIVAGYSAKHEQNKIMAVRRAIFILPHHAEEMRSALKVIRPRRLLILGTSENMVHKIATILNLPDVKKIIRIEDIATKAEMAKAAYYRLKEGKHIIPVPTIELKPHFSGYLIDPLQSFFKKSSRQQRRVLGEKSIVRPVFSYYGKLIIDDITLKSIVKHIAKEKNLRTHLESVENISIVHKKRGQDDLGVEVFCDVTLFFHRQEKFLDVLRPMQEKIREVIEYMTGMIVHKVNIFLKALVVPQEPRRLSVR